jgi:hypothetical protein
MDKLGFARLWRVWGAVKHQMQVDVGESSQSRNGLSSNRCTMGYTLVGIAVIILSNEYSLPGVGHPKQNDEVD